MLEQTIAYHCGPALAGIKPANIATCYKSRMPHLYQEIERLNRELNCRDIYIDVLCECEVRVLLIVYRKSVLETHLQEASMAAFLSVYGYPRGGTVVQHLDCLRTRLRDDEFPHEIGVFLGYPLHDIYGFIHHRDDGCLLSGEWKVYRDAEGAKRLFLRYNACRRAIVNRLKSGHTLARIFCAA